jgi:hypothetical protein
LDLCFKILIERRVDMKIEEVKIRCGNCNKEFVVKNVRITDSLDFGQLVLDLANREGGESLDCPHCEEFLA